MLILFWPCGYMMWRGWWALTATVQMLQQRMCPWAALAGWQAGVSHSLVDVVRASV